MLLIDLLYVNNRLINNLLNDSYNNIDPCGAPKCPACSLGRVGSTWLILIGRKSSVQILGVNAMRAVIIGKVWCCPKCRRKFLFHLGRSCDLGSSLVGEELSVDYRSYMVKILKKVEDG